jgi:hypothetical protein
MINMPGVGQKLLYVSLNMYEYTNFIIVISLKTLYVEDIP